MTRARKSAQPAAGSDAERAGLDVLEGWFAAQGWTPFAFQREAWTRYLSGASGLINVPTGAGKTYAAYGGALAEMIDDLAALRRERARAAASELGLRVLYITPLRAVSRDIELALRRPIEDLGLKLAVESRTGDTSSSRRAKQREKPPQVLVTTPESLSLLLSYDECATLFGSLRCVILDEWHELIASKRGTQTELAMARLRGLAPGVRTWALSATLRNLSEAAAAAVGVGGSASIVRAELPRTTVIETVLPSEPHHLPWAGHMGLRMLPDLIAALESDAQAGSTLIFTNTRAQAELWHQAIRYARPDWSLALHHGSLDREARERVEAGVKSGAIRYVVCTSSLDLGVDFAPVDRVVNVGSPKGIARLLQRAGRSGHRPGAASKVLCCPTHQMELVEIAAVRRALEEGEIEPRLPVNKPLDVLAQHLVTRALGGGFDADALFEEVRRAYSYRDLTREEFDWAMALCREGGGTLKRYPEFNKIALRREGETGPALYRVTQPRIGQLHRLNLGTITMTSGTVDLRYYSGRRLGNIDESFITMLEPGDRFYFAGKTLELVRLDNLEAVVRPARGRTTRTPHWSGIRLPISESLSTEIRAVLASVSAGTEPGENRGGGGGHPETHAARHFFDVQRALSQLPREGQTLIELCQSRDGYHAFVFPFEGRAVHAGLAALLALRLARRVPATFTTAVNDYGLEILCPSDFPYEEHITAELFARGDLTRDAVESMNVSALAKSQFREVARVAGLVFQTFPGARKSGRQMQASSSLLYDVFEQFDPENMLLQQARREVLDRQFEQSRLARTLDRIASGELLMVRTSRPTPLSFPLMVERVGAKVSTETIADRVARMQEQWESSEVMSNVPRGPRKPPGRVISM